MASVIQKEIQECLCEKREHLTGWLQTTPEEKKQVVLGPGGQAAVHSHLEVIDTAMEQASAGRLGVCTVCGGFVEAELLEMDYTACVCLDDLSLDERRSLEMELELAQSVQRSLLPSHVPDTPVLETAAFSRPAQIIGGDYFDFFRFQDGCHGLAIGDVAGHGVSASLHMASMQALLRTLIPINQAPQDVAQHVNQLMIHNVRFTSFMALFLATFDPATLTLTYCNAGHTPPLLLQRGDGMTGVRWLGPTGAAIGLVEDIPFTAETIQLASGDVLLMVTDGVTEAVNPAEQQFGYERLIDLVQTARQASARELILMLRQAIDDFTEGRPLTDDVTIVACKIVG